MALAEHAVDDVQNLLTKANHDLSIVQHRLQKEFQHIYPDNVCLSIIYYCFLLLKHPNASSSFYTWVFRQIHVSLFLESRKSKMISRRSKSSAANSSLPSRFFFCFSFSMKRKGMSISCLLLFFFSFFFFSNVGLLILCPFLIKIMSLASLWGFCA